MPSVALASKGESLLRNRRRALFLTDLSAVALIKNFLLSRFNKKPSEAIASKGESLLRNSRRALFLTDLSAEALIKNF